MAQYWIQIPVENAKEVVQRKIDELVTAGTLPDYAGYTVSYDEDCEVVLDGNALNNFSYDSNTIYFGTFVANFDNNFGIDIAINDFNYNTYYLLNWIDNPPISGNYPYIIWNILDLGNTFDGTQGYFFGYKFTLTAP